MPRANGPRSTTGAQDVPLVDELDDAAAGQRAVGDAAQAAAEPLTAGGAVAEQPGAEEGRLRGAVARDRDERRLGRTGLDGPRPGEDRAHREEPDTVEGPHRREVPVGAGGRPRDGHPSALRVLALHGHGAPCAAGEVAGQRHRHPDHGPDASAEVDRGRQERAAGRHGGDGYRRRVGRRDAAAAVGVRGRRQGQREQGDGPSSCEQAAQVRDGAEARIVHAGCGPVRSAYGVS